MSMRSSLARVFGRGTPTEQKSFTLTDPAALALFGIAPSASGIHVSAASAMRVPAVRRAVSLIAESAATLPFKVHAREDKSALTDHPAYELVHGMANPWTSAEELREQITTDALLRGRGFAQVVRNGVGKPIELHRLDPDAVTPEVTHDGEPTYRLRLAQGGDRLLPFSDVLDLSAFGGVSPIILAREAIALCLAAEGHLSGFFKNGGRPSGVIRHPNKMDAEALKKIAGSWFNSHGGDKAGSTAILDEGMTFEEITMKLADAEFSEVRREQVREIARAFGVPPAILFETSRATWSNYEQSQREFMNGTLRPWLARWQAAYARALLSPQERADTYIECVTNDAASADLAARVAAYGQFRSMGVLTSNEVRARENLPPIKGGDELTNPYTSSAHAPAKPDTPKETTA